MKHCLKYLTSLLLACMLLLGACTESKTNSAEETEIKTMDSTSKEVKDATEKLEDQTKKVEESLEKLDEEFKDK